MKGKHANRAVKRDREQAEHQAAEAEQRRVNLSARLTAAEARQAMMEGRLLAALGQLEQAKAIDADQRERERETTRIAAEADILRSALRRVCAALTRDIEQPRSRGTSNGLVGAEAVDALADLRRAGIARISIDERLTTIQKAKEQPR